MIDRSEKCASRGFDERRMYVDKLQVSLLCREG